MNLWILKMDKEQQEANTRRYNQIGTIIFLGAVFFVILMYLAFEFKAFPSASLVDGPQPTVSPRR